MLPKLYNIPLKLRLFFYSFSEFNSLKFLYFIIEKNIDSLKNYNVLLVQVRKDLDLDFAEKCKL